MESADEIRLALAKSAQGLLQILKDDRAGIEPASPTQRKAAMVLLRKIMTPAQIKAELATVPQAPKRKAKTTKERIREARIAINESPKPKQKRR